MKMLKPGFWDKNFSFISILLYPFSLIYLVLLIIKKILVSSKKFKIPVICVGNIYVGGTGKTPLAIFLSNNLDNNKKPVIIKKNYKNHYDEYELIKSKTDLIVGKNRAAAIIEAIDNKFNVAILDDGFQDSSIYKDLNIICFNSQQLIGNGMIFPSGPLREPFNSLKSADIVIINGHKNSNFERKIRTISNTVEIFYSKYLPVNIDQFKDKKLLAFAGIGNPENFFDLLKSENLNIEKTLKFPDHHEFDTKDLKKIVSIADKNKLEIITTEKDFQRLKSFKIEHINYLELKLEIFEKDNFIKKVTSYL